MGIFIKVKQSVQNSMSQKPIEEGFSNIVMEKCMKEILKKTFEKDLVRILTKMEMSTSD